MAPKMVMVYVPTKLPPNVVKKIDELIADGIHENRSQAVRNILAGGLGMNKTRSKNVHTRPQ